MSDSSGTVHLDIARPETDNAIATLTLHNPPLNIFDIAMRDSLIDRIRAIADIPAVSAVIVRGEGSHFSAGADLSEFGSASSVIEARRIRWDRDPWRILWDLPIPTIAAMKGVAVGSGLEISLLCDIRIAEPDTTLGLPETKLGMLPAAGGTQSLAAVVGPHQALPLIALGSNLSATEALEAGLVTAIANDSDQAAIDLAHRLASLDSGALKQAKRALHGANDLPLASGLALEKRLHAALISNTA